MKVNEVLQVLEMISDNGISLENSIKACKNCGEDSRCDECSLYDEHEESCIISMVEESKEYPKQVTEIHVDEYICPNCGSENMAEQGKIQDSYCPNCGQCIYQEEVK